MVLTLGIETATKVCSVALCDGEKTLASYEINMGMTHSEGLLPQIDQMLQRTGTAKGAIELIAVSRGPGSFTGLRIGLATAEALAYGLKKPMVAVSTLEALAYNLPVPNSTLACLLDAQKGNYYMALYSWQQGQLVEEQAVSIMAEADILHLLGALNTQVLVLGECHKIKGELPPNVLLAPLALRLPRASAVATIGSARHIAGGDENYFGTEPFYLRRSEAEELWEQRQKKQ